MATAAEQYGAEYRRGFRTALSMVLRGLLLVDADRADVGELIASLSHYEEQAKAWAAGADQFAAPPEWHPTAHDLGGDEGDEA